jgi:hypothetical protein
MRKLLFIPFLFIVVIASSQSLQDRAIAIWDFESTAIADSSGNSKTGTITGTVSINSTGGILGSYAETDGSGGDYITIDDTISLGEKWTIAGWVWIDDADISNFFFARYYGQDAIRTEITTGEVRYGVNNTYDNTGDNLTASTWHHVALTYDNSLGSNNIVGYLDGEIIGQFNETSTEANPNQDWQFFANGNGSEKVDGRIDQWAIWREVLDQTTIRDTLYRSGSPVYSSLWSAASTPGTPSRKGYGTWINGTEVYTYIGGVQYTFNGATSPAEGNPYAEGTAEYINYLIGTGIDLRDVVADSDADWELNSPYDDSAYFYQIAQKGLNSVRLIMKAGETSPGIGSTALSNLEEIIDSVVDNDMIAVVDYHVSPTWWGSDGNDGPTTEDWTAFANNWATMAEHLDTLYTSSEVVYELANEPRDEGQADWNVQYKRAIDSIRVYDTDKLILVQPGDWGQMSWIEQGNMTWTDDTLTIPCIHYYEPWWMTTQGLPYDPPFNGEDYSGVVWSNILPTIDIFEEDWEAMFTFIDDNDIPTVNLSEWGVNIYADSASRVDYAAILSWWLRTENGFSPMWWDHYSDFGVYKNPTLGEESEYGWYEPLATNITDNDTRPTLGTYDSTRVLDYSSFTSGDESSWSKYENGSGAVTLSVVGDDLYCNVTGTDYTYLNCRVWSPTFTATRSNVYRITITLRATATRDVAFKQSGNMPWKYMYDVGTSNETKIRTYFMPRTTNTSARIEILLGNTDTDVYIESLTVDEFEPQ